MEAKLRWMEVKASRFSVFSEVDGGGNPDICEWLVSELNRIRK